MEVALDAAFAHVERLSGLLEGHSFVEDGIHDAFAEVGGVGHASACNNVTHSATRCKAAATPPDLKHPRDSKGFPRH